MFYLLYLCHSFTNHQNACLITIFQDGKADVVANDAGDRVTPSMVSFSLEEIVTHLTICCS